MSIGDSVKNFENDPNKYVLFVEKDGSIQAEKKGVWTWLKANVFCKDSYNLRNVVDAINKIDIVSSKRFISVISAKIDKYNKIHSVEHKKFISLSNKGNDFIEKFVIEHLEPYLSGKITPKTEDKERSPLIEALLPELEKKFPNSTLDKESIGKIALDVYIMESAKAFNRFAKEHLPINPDTEKKAVSQYLISLQHAVRIDFKDMNLESEEINKLGVNALKSIYKDPRGAIGEVYKNKKNRVDLQKR